MKSFPSPRHDVLLRRALVAAGVVAAAVGGVATWVLHKGREAERAYPPLGRFVTVDGVRVHYLERGQGTPVVLVHGNMLHAEDFVGSRLVSRLAKNHRVIAVDRPGFGYSERPAGRLWTAEAQAAFLQQTLRILGVTQPVVVGHSWGTLVALELALLSEVKQLILISGYYFPTARVDILPAAFAAIPVLGPILRYTVSPLVARMALNRTVKAMFAPQPVPADFLTFLDREMLVRPKQLQADAQDGVLMIPAAIRLCRRYGELKAPVVIFAGADDLVADFESHALKLHEAINGSELKVLPGVGHMVHYAAPDQIEAVIAD